MIVAGEASGDAHAAKLVRELRAASESEPVLFGATSFALRKAGVEEIVNADHLSIVGLPEIGRALPMFWSAFRKLRNAAVERAADAVILVDFPEFNLKLAGSLRRRGIKVIYYISPQVWAWRKYRLGSIKRNVDLLLTILPFERAWYKERGFERVEYVGNPSVSEVHPESDRPSFFQKHGLDPNRPLVALLPGSRHKEITRILPEMLRSAQNIAEARPEVQFVIALASNRNRNEIDDALRHAGLDAASISFATVENETYDAVAAADAAAVASGTATLETAILGTPMAIVYKTSEFNYRLFSPMIDVPHFGLVNLVAGERVAAELIQDDFNAGSLAAEVLRLLDPEMNRAARRRLAEVKTQLGDGGASRKAAVAILNLLRKE